MCYVFLNLKKVSTNNSVKKEELEFGIRMTVENGVSIFGVEDVDNALKNGAIVKSIKSNDALMQKTGESDGNVNMYFSGGTFTVVVEKIIKPI